MSRCKENKEEICKSYPLCYGCNSFEKPTNYDRIRNMTIEEMAAFITELNIKCNPKLKKSKNVIAKYIVAVKNKKWLEAEVENNGKSNNL